MNWHRVKIRRSDKLFSLFIRTRDGWKCKKCKRWFPKPEDNEGRTPGNLHCSHFFSRRAESTRFYPDNCDAFCAGCHKDFDSDRAGYEEWKKEQLGERDFKLLLVQHNSYKQRDDKLDAMYAKKLLDEV